LSTVHLKSSHFKIVFIVVCLKQFALLHCSVLSTSPAWQIEAVPADFELPSEMQVAPVLATDLAPPPPHFPHLRAP
jgi:hypothetical protein